MAVIIAKGAGAGHRLTNACNKEVSALVTAGSPQEIAEKEANAWATRWREAQGEAAVEEALRGKGLLLRSLREKAL